MHSYMHPIHQALVLLGGVMFCRAAAFRVPFAFGAGHRDSLARANAAARGGCFGSRHRLAAYDEPTMGFKSPLDVLKQGIARAGAGPYDKDAVQSAVNNYTSGSKVVVFSWTRCPFCRKAKRLVEDLLQDPSEYEFVELDEREDGNAIRYELSQITGRTSVPQIWIDGEFIGGYNDGPGISTLMDRGELVPKLEAAGCTLRGA